MTRIYEYEADTVVIDLTAMGTVTQEGVHYLESLVQTLGVMGIDAAITGVKPDHAQKLHLLKREMNLRFEASLESILSTAAAKS